MRIIFCFAIAFIYGFTLNAQTDYKIKKNATICGHDYLNNKNILAQEYLFSEKIYKWHIDSLKNLASIQTINQKQIGNLILFDLSSKEIKWTDIIDFNLSSIYHFTNTLIETKNKTSYSLNLENGKTLWEAPTSIYFSGIQNSIGVGYKSPSISGVNLTDGKIIWDRKIEFGKNVQNIIHINDTVIILSNGIHFLNLLNGKGWDYYSTIGKFDNNVNVNNLLNQDSSLYFTFKNEAVKLDYNGEIKWRSYINKEALGRTIVFSNDSVLYIIGLGFYFNDNNKFTKTSPFIASFNKINGHQLYYHQFSWKDSYINNYKVKYDTLYIAFQNRVAMFSLANGTLLKEHLYNIEKFGDIVFFADKSFYLMQDSIFKTLNLTDIKLNFILTKSGNVLAINDNLEIVNQLDKSKIYFCGLEFNNIYFLTNDENNMLLINNQGKKLADFHASRKSTLSANRFYYTQDNKFIEIDLKDIIKTK